MPFRSVRAGASPLVRSDATAIHALGETHDFPTASACPPVIAGPKERAQWAMDELTVLVSASCAADDVVTPGPVVLGRKRLGTHGSVHVRRGWRSGLTVAIAAWPSLVNAVLVAVIPTSRLQNWLYRTVLTGFALAGLVVAVSLASNAAVLMAVVGPVRRRHPDYRPGAATPCTAASPLVGETGGEGSACVGTWPDPRSRGRVSKGTPPGSSE
jgi:hypothetical protein